MQRIYIRYMNEKSDRVTASGFDKPKRTPLAKLFVVGK
jgi:hypothetical protein